MTTQGCTPTLQSRVYFQGSRFQAIKHIPFLVSRKTEVLHASRGCTSCILFIVCIKEEVTGISNNRIVGQSSENDTR